MKQGIQLSKLCFVFLFMPMLIQNVFAQNDYQYVKTYDGVGFYSRWKKDNYAEASHLNLMIVNTTRESKHVRFAIEWQDRLGNTISTTTISGFSLKPEQTKSGDFDGLYWYAPKGFSSSQVRPILVEVEIE